MGKHSKQVKKRKVKLNIRYLVIIIIIAILIVTGIYIYRNKDSIKNIIFKENNKPNNTSKLSDSIINDVSIENECLVIKSLTDYNKIIEYKFENNNLKTVIIYEQFEEKQQYENKKKNYEEQENIVIKEANEQKLSIEIEKRDFGSDKDLTYEQIQDKYLVQIIGAYEKK